MRWRWGLVAIVLGAACASLDGLSGEAPGPDGGAVPDSGAVPDADANADVAPLSEASSGATSDASEASPSDASDASDAGMDFCDGLGAGTVMFCADFDRGPIAWTAMSGATSLIDASTSPPNGVLIQTTGGPLGLGGSTGSLQKEIPPLLTPATTLSFAFDLRVELASGSNSSVVATIGHHTAGADFSLSLETSDGSHFVVLEQTPGADATASSQVISTGLPALPPGQWGHFEFRFVTASIKNVTKLQALENGLPTASILLDDTLQPITKDLFIRIGGLTSFGKPGSSAVIFDNVVVRAF